jgi:hypothetical protein
VVNKGALASLAVIFAIGAWLVTAPFVLRYQPDGARWTGATRLDVAVGAALAVSGAAAFLAALTGRVGDLYRQAGAAAEPATATE